ncbi:hypothetical protein BDZ89DRAFT_1080235 [Hymenopellis radicata]|nr:hypothetical protein BDZ89DRAFT_1080235 [Hymenopellis radicata]
MSNEFVIGVSPFLFIVKGGPRPAFFAEMQNAFADLAAVYEAGPEQRGQVAYREYYFWKRISEIMSDTFLKNIDGLSNFQPLQMFEAVPGSRSMDLFEELYLKAKRLRNEGGPGSLREMKQAADAQALRDGRYFRLGTSTGRGAEDATDPNLNVGQTTPRQGMAPSGYRNQARTAAQTHPYSRNARSPSAAPAFERKTRRSIHASTRSAASGSHVTASDGEVPLGSWALRRQGMSGDEIYDELLARPKEPLIPACVECQNADEVCYGLEGATRKNGKRPACIRCRAWSRKCSNCDLDEEDA